MNSKLKHIRSLGSITYVPQGNGNFGCFKGCPLETIVLPETLLDIRAFAFHNVTTVTEMNLPASLNIISSLPTGTWADGLEVNLPNLTSLNQVFATLGIKSVLDLGSITNLSASGGNQEANGEFRACQQLEKVILPSGYTQTDASNALPKSS